MAYIPFPADEKYLSDDPTQNGGLGRFVDVLSAAACTEVFAAVVIRSASDGMYVASLSAAMDS